MVIIAGPPGAARGITAGSAGVGQVAGLVPGQTPVAGNGQVQITVGGAHRKAGIALSRAVIINTVRNVVKLHKQHVQFTVTLGKAHFRGLQLPGAAAAIGLIPVEVVSRPKVGVILRPVENTASQQSGLTARVGVSRPKPSAPDSMKIAIGGNQSRQVRVWTIPVFAVDVPTDVHPWLPAKAIIVRNLIVNIVVPLIKIPTLIAGAGVARVAGTGQISGPDQGHLSIVIGGYIIPRRIHRVHNVGRVVPCSSRVPPHFTEIVQRLRITGTNTGFQSKNMEHSIAGTFLVTEFRPDHFLIGVAAIFSHLPGNLRLSAEVRQTRAGIPVKMTISKTIRPFPVVTTDNSAAILGCVETDKTGIIIGRLQTGFNTETSRHGVPTVIPVLTPKEDRTRHGHPAEMNNHGVRAAMPAPANHTSH